MWPDRGTGKAPGVQKEERGLSRLGDTARAMSQENVEFVRSIYSAWERGDFSAAEWAAPRDRVRDRRGPHREPGLGVAGMAEAWREVLECLGGPAPEADEYRALDDARVLVLFRFSGRGKTSGLELGQMQSGGSEPVPCPRRQGDEARHLLGPRASASPTSAFRSKTLTPTPEPAGYCAGDVAGERGDRARCPVPHIAAPDTSGCTANAGSADCLSASPLCTSFYAARGRLPVRSRLRRR